MTSSSPTSSSAMHQHQHQNQNQNQLPSYATLSLLPAGFLTLPEHFFCADQTNKSVRNTVPSMSFLVQHPSTGTRIIFDLGMRKILENYPPELQPHLRTRQPIETIPDVSDSLRAGGLHPDDIDLVVLSHVHYDHVGTPRDFQKAHFVVGPGARHLLQHGMRYHSAAKFEKGLLPEDRTIELPEQAILPTQDATPVENDLPPTKKALKDLLKSADKTWRSLEPFPNAMDLFGDGLIFIVDSPGHLVGHINLLIRIGPDGWVYLAGDACHHGRLLDGDTEFATWEENGMHVCIHADKEMATSTLRNIQEARTKGFQGRGVVEVIFAHDSGWYHSHQDAIFPGIFQGPAAAQT